MARAAFLNGRRWPFANLLCSNGEDRHVHSQLLRKALLAQIAEGKLCAGENERMPLNVVGQLDHMHVCYEGVLYTTSALASSHLDLMTAMNFTSTAIYRTRKPRVMSTPVGVNAMGKQATPHICTCWYPVEG